MLADTIPMACCCYLPPVARLWRRSCRLRKRKLYRELRRRSNKEGVLDRKKGPAVS